VERVKISVWTLALTLCSVPVGANTCLGPKNPVHASTVCGTVRDPVGDSVADLHLQLVDRGKAVIAEVHTDSMGNFAFQPLPKGEYNLTTDSTVWHLFWPILVTDSKSAKNCKRPMTIKLNLGCPASVSKKGYHVKWGGS
jgi:Carboxypeptidase regulatory-like domain